MMLPEGQTYDAFLATWHETAAQSLKGLDSKARKYVFYARYNQVRSDAVHAAYTPSASAVQAVRAMLDVGGPQRWIVLTEDWCADSAFSLPVVAELAGLDERITLRILPRDAHLDVMDEYLTNGGRSIPKLVVFDQETGTELFQWGPRPEGGVAERERLLTDGVKGAAVSAGLVAWYEAGGWREVERELTRLITAAREAVTGSSRTVPGTAS